MELHGRQHLFQTRRSSDLEAGWNGYGARDLSLDRRVARWAPVGGKKRTARREVHLHVTGRIESRVMMADDCVVFVVDDNERIREALGELSSEEHTSELKSLMSISYAVFCLTKKKKY